MEVKTERCSSGAWSIPAAAARTIPEDRLGVGAWWWHRGWMTLLIDRNISRKVTKQCDKLTSLCSDASQQTWKQGCQSQEPSVSSGKQEYDDAELWTPSQHRYLLLGHLKVHFSLYLCFSPYLRLFPTIPHLLPGRGVFLGECLHRYQPTLPWSELLGAYTAVTTVIYRPFSPTRILSLKTEPFLFTLLFM